MVYLGVFVASVALTVPLVVWSERNRSPGRAALVGGAGLAVALAALVWAQANFDALLGALVLYFGAFNFLEARLPAALTEAAGEASPRRGPRRVRDLPVRGRLRGGRAGRRRCSEAAGTVTGIFAVAALASVSPGCLVAARRKSAPNPAGFDGARRGAGRLQ